MGLLFAQHLRKFQPSNHAIDLLEVDTTRVNETDHHIKPVLAEHALSELALSSVKQRSLADFLTDGSVPKLSAAATALTGVTIRVYNADGRLVLPGDGSDSWKLVDTSHDELAPEPESVITAMRHAPKGGALALESGHAVLPIHSGQVPIAAIVVDPHDSEADTVLVLAQQLASSTTERCTEEWQLRRRNAELATLFDVSTLFVAARNLDETLTAAIRASATVLHADAGIIHLLDSAGAVEGEAAWGVDDEFRRNFAELPSPRANDARVFAGGVVVEADVRTSSSTDFAALAQRAGLASMMSVGLYFGRHLLGVLRVFSARPSTFDAEDQRIMQALGMQIAAAVQSARRDDEARAERQTKRHLKLAADVQRRMLPTRFPEHRGISIGARYESSLELGGDFYDVQAVGNRFTFLVGDVVGKGVPAALLMASVRSMFRSLGLRFERTDSVEEAMRRVNVALAEDTKANEFATAFLGLVDPQTRELIYCNAGHEPALVFRPTASGEYRVIELETGGPLLGVDSEFLYQRATFELHPGDTVLAFTDGALESMDFESKKYGRERLHKSVIDHLAQTPEISAQMLSDQLLWDVRRFTGLSGVSDDITLFAMRLSSTEII